MKKIVVMEPLGVSSKELDSLFQSLVDVEWVQYDQRANTDEELIARGKDAQVIVIANQTIHKQVIDGWENVELISVAFTGVDHLPVAYCQQKGIVVCNASGYSTNAVSELVFGLAIGCLRKIKENDLVIRQGGTKDGLVGSELSGSTFGIIGLGAIGQQVAKLANAFGCHVIGYNRSPKMVDGVTLKTKEEVFQQADILSLHLSLSDQTKGFVDERVLSMMKPTAILINCARGPIIDQDALVKALHQKQIAAAAIDVFDQEPPLSMDHPLLHTPNTIVTPHIAFASQQAMVKRAKIVVDVIDHYLHGQPIHVVK